MPVEIKRGILNVKLSNGSYVSLDVLAQESTTQSLARITAARDNALAQISNISELENMIADVFDENRAYLKGEYVIHVSYEETSDPNNPQEINRLYKFQSAHTGAWTGLDVSQVVLASEIADFRNNIVIVSPTEPLIPSNRVWVDSSGEDEVEVPTIDEFNRVNNELIDTGNALAAANDVIERLNREILMLQAQSEDAIYNHREENGVLYLLNKNGDVVGEGISGIGGGGGGGGSGGNNATITVTNTSGWMSKTISRGNTCVATLNWSSLENDTPTGDGTLSVIISGSVRSRINVAQGNVNIDLAQYANVGLNIIKISIADVYGNSRTINFSVSVVELSITSSFDTSIAYSGPIQFPYTPIGNVTKTVYFILDNGTPDTFITPISNRQLTYTIPQQLYGSHTLRCYFEAQIDGQTIRSNELYYEFICIDASSNAPIITSNFETTEIPQYTPIHINYLVYNPASMVSDVTIKVNNETVSVLTNVDRTEHIFDWRPVATGTLVIQIISGATTKTFTLNITESDVQVHAETENLALYLSSSGRSNDEASEERSTWNYNNIQSIMSNFNWTSDGWQHDNDGTPVLRVSGDARVTIPYKIFENDFRGTGKTIEIEFATSTVMDYDAVILSCLSGGRGLSVTSQKAILKSEQSEISMQYKENEHVRLSFVVEKRSENRLIYCYVNGIVSGCVQYPADDDFSQAVPVNISVGSNDCVIDIYCIRVYDNDLSRGQILDNWIADTQVLDDLIARYNRNLVYDQYGNIVIAQLPNTLPYMIHEAAELPQYKGDKKTIDVQYTDPLHTEKSFTATGVQDNVQGTSSAPYARKNYDNQYKNGFETNNGHTDNYQLDNSIIPFNRFVLKADVASSEGANNVELVKLYCDITPYKTREMLANSKVRQGIYGFPIVLFWRNSDTGEVKFMGKYNFNLPKRAPAPYGYSGNMESWEFQNNTSDLMLFKSDYFDQTMYTDPDTGETKELWRYDYEARFPNDEWVDYTKLQELQSFIVSTDRSKATGNTLPAPVVYNEVTYTTDTSDYRLAKFKTEFGNYAEIQSFMFYYIFTEFFLMVDSRAKNLFIGFSGSDTDPTKVQHIDRKAVAEPYDMDTALGTNNEGSLVFGYSLEDTDHLTGGANVFNGQDSILWNNVRDAFSNEIRQMYQRLRSEGTLSYAEVERRFEEHQEKWPEAVWNEDAYFKYIAPLIQPDPGKEPTAVYLPMLQGAKAEQRKWWLYNRFRYMDSKWNAGDALRQVIQLRGYAKADVTLTPYTDIYPTVKYASYLVQQRGTHGQPTTLVCPLDNVNDTEIYIYSAPQIASCGDLSGLKVGFADFSMGVNLQSIKVGDASQSYENPNLDNLTLGSNKLLKTLDARNCTALGTGDQKSVDLSGCTAIEDVYFDGTKIAGVTLPNGGVLKTLHLPSTITNLTILNQTGITDFSVPSYANITTLRLENVSGTIDSATIVSALAANSRLRVIGFNWNLASYAALESLYDKLDTMRGLNESGGNTDHAQMQGTIHIPSISGDQLAALQSRAIQYNNITVTYDHITTTLNYYNYEGTTLLHTETITDGGNGTWATQPTHDATPAYTFAFIGWSRTANSTTADVTATQAVTANRNVYAAYTLTGRTYTVTFAKNSTDGGGTLQTVNNVPYGGSATYTGSTPTTTRGNDFAFDGWSPAPTNIQGNTTCYAVFRDISLPLYKYLSRTMTAYESDTATKVAQYAFYNMTTLETVETTALTIEQYAFNNCTKLREVDLKATSGQVSIANYAFNSCKAITALIIRSNTVATLAGSNALPAGPFTALNGAIYVPANLVDTYKAATNWSVYANRIYPISAHPVTNFDTIQDSWAEIVNKINAGTHTYQIGDTKSVTYGGDKTVQMELVSLTTEGTAKTAWIMKNFVETRVMNSNMKPYDETTMHTYMNEIYESLPSELKAGIKAVDKTWYDGVNNTVKTTSEKVWLPSSREVGLTSNYLKESEGTQYTTKFTDSTSRVKYNLTTGSADNWWLRSAGSSSSFLCVGGGGSGGYYSPYGACGVAAGFCI